MTKHTLHITRLYNRPTVECEWCALYDIQFSIVSGGK